MMLAPASLTNFEHSKLDLPVVITSSTIRTLLLFFIIKSRLSLNSPFTLSANIVSLFNNFHKDSQKSMATLCDIKVSKATALAPIT